MGTARSPAAEETGARGLGYPSWLGVVAALLLGGRVRPLRLPIPAPAAVTGTLLLLALAVGYPLTNGPLPR